MFSFHATKVFHSIEGGAIAFHDKRYGIPLHELKNFGIHSEEDVEAIGGNAKLDEFRAAMGICNLKRMNICIAARKKVHDRYFERLSGVEGITLCCTQDDVEPNYAYLPVYFDPDLYYKSRDTVYAQLREHDIYSRKYFYPAINELSCYAGKYDQNTPVAHDVSMNILTLPMYEGLSFEDVDRICKLVLE